MNRQAKTLAALVGLLAASAVLTGCFEVRENSQPAGDEVYNDGGPSGGADYGVVDNADGQCIHTTTGEGTTNQASNTCQQGEINEDGPA